LSELERWSGRTRTGNPRCSIARPEGLSHPAQVVAHVTTLPAKLATEMPRTPPRRSRPFWFPLLGLGFALAGADKLLGQPGYRRLFRRWGWSQDAMRVVGACEVAGGVLIASSWGRRLGGLALTAASTAVLTAEMERAESSRALPRILLLATAIMAALPAPANGLSTLRRT
jgi:hypothetical protein